MGVTAPSPLWDGLPVVGGTALCGRDRPLWEGLPFVGGTAPSPMWEGLPLVGRTAFGGRDCLLWEGLPFVRGTAPSPLWVGLSFKTTNSNKNAFLLNSMETGPLFFCEFNDPYSSLSHFSGVG